MASIYQTIAKQYLNAFKASQKHADAIHVANVSLVQAWAEHSNGDHVKAVLNDTFAAIRFMPHGLDMDRWIEWWKDRGMAFDPLAEAGQWFRYNCGSYDASIGGDVSALPHWATYAKPEEAKGVVRKALDFEDMLKKLLDRADKRKRDANKGHPDDIIDSGLVAAIREAVRVYHQPKPDTAQQPVNPDGTITNMPKRKRTPKAKPETAPVVEQAA